MFQMESNNQSEKNQRDYELYLEANPHKRKCDFREHSALTEEVLSEINKVLKEHMDKLSGGDDWYDIDKSRMAFIESYTSDCPGWCGQIALVIWGSVCFQTVLINDKEKGWRIAYEVMEDGLTVYERLGSEGRTPFTIRPPKQTKRVCCQNPNNLES